MYVKVKNAAGETIALEAIEPVVYVYRQRRNGALLRCVQPLGQGILSRDGRVIYQLPGKETLPQAVAAAEIITEAEFHALNAQQA